MTREEFLNFREFWIFDDVDWNDVSGEGGYDIDVNNPAQRMKYLKNEGVRDVTLRMCHMDFTHAGRFTLKFRNQGFDSNGFGKNRMDENGEAVSYLYGYVTSPDVCYYDAEFVSHSKLAYDVSLYLEQFRESAEFTGISDAFGDLFYALKVEDHSEFEALTRRNGFEFGKNGSITLDCSRQHNVIFSLTVFPAVS